MSVLHEIPLPGLDGANPLGFLAALGTWRTTDSLYPGTKMYWKPIGGHWTPVFLVRENVAIEDFVTQLNKQLDKGKTNDVFSLNKDLKIPIDRFKKKALDLQNRNENDLLDWMSALGSDACSDKWNNIQNTRFDLMNAGRQYFLETIRFLIENTSHADIENTLFEKWAYASQKGGMRWDIEEDRRYALRWKDPSPDPTMTQRGANRLAIESLPLFPTAPIGQWLETTGFISRGKKNTFFTWPIWCQPIPISVCKSIIGSVGNATQENASTFHGMGIEAVFRSQRIWKGKAPNDYSNFTPATQVC